MNTETLEGTIIWRRLDLPGHDGCGLWSLADGWRLSGRALFTMDGEPCSLSYEVECDAQWISRSGTIDGWIGGNRVSIRIAAMPGRRWTLNGEEQPAVEGCIDLDLGFTPSTNVIALRRLALDIGEGSDVASAWLEFPGRPLVRLEQHYHRASAGRYDYRAPGIDFEAVLEATEIGFSTSYPPLWKMESMK
jgi:uncharacterized protein